MAEYPVVRIGQFDDYPAQTFTLKDSDGTAVDLTDATAVYLSARRIDTGELIINNSEVTIGDTPTDGEVTWDPADDSGCTDVAVDLKARFCIVWSGPKYQRSEFFVIRVTDAIASANPS